MNHREGTNLLSPVSNIPMSVMCLALPREPCGNNWGPERAGQFCTPHLPWLLGIDLSGFAYWKSPVPMDLSI